MLMEYIIRQPQLMKSVMFLPLMQHMRSLHALIQHTLPLMSPHPPTRHMRPLNIRVRVTPLQSIIIFLPPLIWHMRSLDPVIQHMLPQMFPHPPTRHMRPLNIRVRVTPLQSIIIFLPPLIWHMRSLHPVIQHMLPQMSPHPPTRNMKLLNIRVELMPLFMKPIIYQPPLIEYMIPQPPLMQRVRLLHPPILHTLPLMSPHPPTKHMRLLNIRVGVTPLQMKYTVCQPPLIESMIFLLRLMQHMRSLHPVIQHTLPLMSPHPPTRHIRLLNLRVVVTHLLMKPIVCQPPLMEYMISLPPLMQRLRSLHPLILHTPPRIFLHLPTRHMKTLRIGVRVLLSLMNTSEIAS